MSQAPPERSGTLPGGWRAGDRVRVGINMTGTVTGQAEPTDWDREPRLLVDIDGHDWTACPVLSILTRMDQWRV